MFVVDTNVLVYAADRDAQEHRRCRMQLDNWRADPVPWYVTWPIIYEFLRVGTHPRVFRRPMPMADAWAFVRAVLAAPALAVLAPGRHHADVAERTLAEIPGLRGNLLHDVHTAVLMREHGISTIYTRDSDFHRFPFLRVVDPLSD